MHHHQHRRRGQCDDAIRIIHDYLMFISTFSSYHANRSFHCLFIYRIVYFQSTFISHTVTHFRWKTRISFYFEMFNWTILFFLVSIIRRFTWWQTWSTTAIVHSMTLYKAHVPNSNCPFSYRQCSSLSAWFVVVSDILSTNRDYFRFHSFYSTSSAAFRLYCSFRLYWSFHSTWSPLFSYRCICCQSSS